MVSLARKHLPQPVRSWLRTSLDEVNRAVGTLDPTANGQAPTEPAPPPGGPSDVPPDGWVDLSAAGESALLRGLLRGDVPRYLVDVGAHDGVTISNSRPFVLEGWTSLLVEPHPVLFERLVARYDGVANAILVNKACGPENGILPLYFGAGGAETGTSTLCTDQNAWFDATRTEEFIDVEVVTLTNLLEEHGYPRDFAVLLVDAEGMDYEVLTGLDFARFQPRIVVTEEYILDPHKHNAKYRLLLDNGYTWITQRGSNTFWVRTEWVLPVLDLA